MVSQLKVSTFTFTFHVMWLPLYLTIDNGYNSLLLLRCGKRLTNRLIVFKRQFQYLWRQSVDCIACSWFQNYISHGSANGFLAFYYFLFVFQRQQRKRLLKIRTQRSLMPMGFWASFASTWVRKEKNVLGLLSLDWVCTRSLTLGSLCGPVKHPLLVTLVLLTHKLLSTLLHLTLKALVITTRKELRFELRFVLGWDLASWVIIVMKQH